MKDGKVFRRNVFQAIGVLLYCMLLVLVGAVALVLLIAIIATLQ